MDSNEEHFKDIDEKKHLLLLFILKEHGVFPDEIIHIIIKMNHDLVCTLKIVTISPSNCRHHHLRVTHFCNEHHTMKCVLFSKKDSIRYFKLDGYDTIQLDNDWMEMLEYRFRLNENGILVYDHTNVPDVYLEIEERYFNESLIKGVNAMIRSNTRDKRMESEDEREKAYGIQNLRRQIILNQFMDILK